MFIGFIAPYEELQSMANELVALNKYNAKVYMGDMEEGVRAAREAIAEGAQVLISRGGTAILIRKLLGVDVVEIKPSVYSAFAYIHTHTVPEMRIAVIGFSPLVNICRPVCDILQRTYTTYEVQDLESTHATIDEMACWNPDIVIGDAISVRLAEERGFRTHLIESSRETLADALEQGTAILNNLQSHLANESRLSTVLDCAYEGTLLIDARGVVRTVNRQGLKILGAGQAKIIGQPYVSIFPAAEIKDAVTSGQNRRNILVVIRDKRIVCDVFCTGLDAAVDSAVVVFQPVEHLQQRENTIRAKLMAKGLYARYNFSDIIHKSDAMKETVAIAREYAQTECNIMIQGETGTGKELFAQSIHNASSRATGPFVALNCAALPGNLLESELFGYAPGAFTGALPSGKTGLFEMAHNGTLFLDEIAEMDIFLQARLLRTLQAREVMRVGDDKVIPINVRLISATNKEPEEEVRNGRMRTDLFFRLNVLDLAIPPLRDRQQDIDLLFRHYTHVYGQKYGSIPYSPSKAFLSGLMEYSWPGNVRELENFAEKCVTLSGMSRMIVPKSVITAKPPLTGNGNARQTLEQMSCAYVQEIIRQEKGNIARAAVILDIDRNTVKRWLAKDAGS
jgi:Transcriptional regulator containing PAS, AAA-type ATPase, and DNA-binding domains